MPARVTSILILLTCWLQGSEPLKLGERSELFLDDHLIERMDGLTRVMHQPTDVAANPVLHPEHPWEHRRIPFGSVLWFPKERKFKCWYLAMNIYDSRPGGRGYRKDFHVPINEAAYICYAESTDGINWHKPELGLREYRGSKRNNILLTCPGTHFDSTTVMYLPDDKEWPYRMMTFIGRWPYREDLVKKQWGDPPPFGIQRHGHYAFGSKDGLRWQELNHNDPVLRAHDRSMFWWDAERQIFVGAAKQSHDGKRAQRYAWSRNMIDWKLTDDWIHRADEKDHPGDEGEAAYGFPHGSQWLGFGEMRRVRQGKGWRETKINWELLTSRNGRSWLRPLRDPFFVDAGKETWRFQVFKVFANPPIERDGRLLIYYGGKTGMVSIDEGYEPFQAMCLATIRKDGFVSLRAGKEKGELITRPMIVSAGDLRLNLQSRENSTAQVEITDPAGKVIAGYALQECDALPEDGLNIPVRWNGRDVSRLAGRGIRLRFVLKNAELYSLRLAVDRQP